MRAYTRKDMQNSEGLVNSSVAANFNTPTPDDEILSCVARAVKTKSQNKPRSRAVQDRLEAAGLPVYRRATRRRKDVRITSKYLKISTRNAGDPLLIKTAGSTCAFPAKLPACLFSRALLQETLDVLSTYVLFPCWLLPRETFDSRYYIRCLFC